MTVFPLALEVEFFTAGPPVVDRFGNEHPGPGTWSPVKVFGWYVNKPLEESGDSVLRTVDELTLYSPTTPGPSGKIRLPDGSEWEVSGNAEDYNNNPWFAPGLLVIHAQKVEG